MIVSCIWLVRLHCNVSLATALLCLVWILYHGPFQILVILRQFCFFFVRISLWYRLWCSCILTVFFICLAAELMNQLCLNRLIRVFANVAIEGRLWILALMLINAISWRRVYTNITFFVVKIDPCIRFLIDRHTPLHAWLVSKIFMLR